MEGARAIREEAAYLRRGVSVAPPSAGQRRLTLGEYCEQTRDDTLLREWHPTQNGALTPRDVVACARRRVWWICGEGHVWSDGCEPGGKEKNGLSRVRRRGKQREPAARSGSRGAASGVAALVIRRRQYC